MQNERWPNSRRLFYFQSSSYWLPLRPYVGRSSRNLLLDASPPPGTARFLLAVMMVVLVNYYWVRPTVPNKTIKLISKQTNVCYHTEPSARLSILKLGHSYQDFEKVSIRLDLNKLPFKFETAIYYTCIEMGRHHPVDFFPMGQDFHKGIRVREC